MAQSMQCLRRSENSKGTGTVHSWAASSARGEWGSARSGCSSSAQSPAVLGTRHPWAPWLSLTPLPSRRAGHAEDRDWLLTHTEGSRLSPLGRSLSWSGREPIHFPEGSVEAPGSGSHAGTEPRERGPLPAAPQSEGSWAASPEHVSLSTSNLCLKSLLGLKVTLQLSICTDALKEKRGSASQFIFQIGDKNWLVMAENSTKDYYCWLISLWQKVR